MDRSCKIISTNKKGILRGIPFLLYTSLTTELLPFTIPFIDKVINATNCVINIINNEIVFFSKPAPPNIIV
ncbi:hypothetical protein BC2926_20480 [Bacillus cereus]|nr:hypothetical protein BC2926_20480 [Bacillus cereus]